MSHCGLLFECPLPEGGSEYTSIPLTGVAVEVQIIDLVAQVTVTQSYVNKENQPIEAIYLFPLDEGAGVCEFSAEIEGRQIVGHVKKAEEAKEDYNEAIQSGQSAFLLEEKLPDVFKAKVGNLAPGSGARIKLTYVTELKVEPDGDIRFYLPTTIAPRYVPRADNSSVASDLANVTYTAASKYKVEFNAWVTMGSAIKEIRSPTHKLSVKVLSETPNKGKITLADVVTTMDRDLVLLVKLNEPNQPRLICQKSDNGTAALMLSIVPSFKLADQKTELIFLIDRSGSMTGEGIQQAKQALKLFLHSLPVDCYLNVVGFGSTFKTLFPKSQKYDDESLATAKSYANDLDADLGGTGILAPLEWVAKQPIIEGYLRQMFILTDGEVSNADHVISLIRRESGKARVFALGLGSSASHHLIEGMARAGNGTALFASLDERLEKKVLQQLQDSLQPSLTDVKVKWDGYDEKDLERKDTNATVQTEKTLIGYGKPVKQVEAPRPVEVPPKFRQAPEIGSIPPVFDGRHTVVYTLLAEGAHIPKWAEISASSPDGPLSIRVDLAKNTLENGFLIQRLAAKKLIVLLQDKIIGSGSEDNENLKSEIITLACQHGLASRYTSYVAIDTKENKELKDNWMNMKSRDIPIEVAYAWGGGFGGSGGAPMALACSAMPRSIDLCTGVPPLQMKLVSTCAITCVNNSATPYMAMADMNECENVASDSDPTEFMLVEEEKPTTLPEEKFDVATASDDDKLIHLVSAQRFDGSFQIGVELAELLKSNVDEIKERGKNVHADDQTWATTLAVAYLNKVLTSLRDSWLLVANKAEKWVASKAAPETLQEEALKFLKEKLNV